MNFGLTNQRYPTMIPPKDPRLSRNLTSASLKTKAEVNRSIESFLNRNYSRPIQHATIEGKTFDQSNINAASASKATTFGNGVRMPFAHEKSDPNIDNVQFKVGSENLSSF